MNKPIFTISPLSTNLWPGESRNNDHDILQFKGTSCQVGETMKKIHHKIRTFKTLFDILREHYRDEFRFYLQ